jgi:hypothetical protein
MSNILLYSYPIFNLRSFNLEACRRSHNLEGIFELYRESLIDLYIEGEHIEELLLKLNVVNLLKKTILQISNLPLISQG